MMEQYDDHTWLTLDGQPWKIYGLEAGIVMLWRVDVDCRNWFTTFDVGMMDHESYCDAAVALLRLDGHTAGAVSLCPHGQPH